jgi:hypothetical protein
MDLRKPVPLWALLLGILISGSVAAGLAYLPRLLGPGGPDFNLTLSSNPVLVQANKGNGSIVKVESVRGFVGVVTFGIISPSALTTRLIQPQLGDQNQIVLGTVGNLTLFTDSSIVGDYSVRIVATGGPTSHYVDLVVRVQDLAIAANTTSITVARGSSGTIGIALKSLGLSGNVSLQSGVCHLASSACPVDTYVSLRLAPSNVILQPGGSATVILTVTVSNSDYPGTDYIGISATKNSWKWDLPSIQLTIV